MELVNQVPLPDQHHLHGFFMVMVIIIAPHERDGAPMGRFLG